MRREALDPRLTPARPDLAARHLRGLVEAEHYAEGRAMEVVAPLAALRHDPQPDARLDTEALRGERVTVYEEREGWAWGQLETDHYVGYLPTEALAEVGPGQTHKVVALRSFVFPGPDGKLPPVAALPLGARVAVGEAIGGFVRTGDGFLWAGHLAPIDHVEADFVAVAERFLGVPYLWGGKTALGIDCSGLVQLSLAAAGLAAPRDSDVQARDLGVPLPVGERLRRGDLVFWRGHVGIMRDADILLHANGHSMAVTSEPLAEARHRIEAAGAATVASMRRL